MLWETTIDDYKKGYSNTAAPLIVKDMVLSALPEASGEFAAISTLMTQRPASADGVFTPSPATANPACRNLGRQFLQNGGGSTWITGTYDPELNLIYWGIGNPGPDMDGDGAPGDNLYTHAPRRHRRRYRKLKWYFQLTPHDVHDWDSVADPVLMDATDQGKKVQSRRASQSQWILLPARPHRPASS